MMVGALVGHVIEMGDTYNCYISMCGDQWKALDCKLRLGPPTIDSSIPKLNIISNMYKLWSYYYCLVLINEKERKFVLLLLS